MTIFNVGYRIGRRPLLMGILVAVGAVVADASGQKPQPPLVYVDAATLADFMQRVDVYMVLHRKVDATLQEPPRDGRPEAFIEHERTFAKSIQKERPNAKAGDVFTKPMRTGVRRRLASVFRGRDIKKTILDEDTAHIALQVNAQYPEGAPFSTTPLQVLQGLPKLPDGLEYRFIGDRLILLDAHARLIVDVVTKVFP